MSSPFRLSHFQTVTVFLLISMTDMMMNAIAFTINSPMHNTFTTRWQHPLYSSYNYNPIISRVIMAASNQAHSGSGNSLHKVPENDDTPIPFIEPDKTSFIECYADSIAIVNGVEYTIGSPCDNSVALCYFDESEQLLPIELEDELMDEIFDIAASIVEDEFGEELTLERTPQTLTLVGELEEDGGDEDEMDEEDDDDDFMDDDEEDVEILLSFEHEGTEYCLVKLLDPVLLVGKAISEEEQKVMLLTPEESDEVMPILEELFLKYQDEDDSILP